MRRPKENANCPYCLSPIDTGQEKVRCPKCGVTHHSACWQANGKCSIYGCDGWALWSDKVTDKLAPETAETVEISNAEPAKPSAPEEVRCIKCGALVRRGHMLCMDCSKKHWRFFENCFGPSILLFCGTAFVITLIVRIFV